MKNLDFAKKIKNYLHENPELSSKEFETRKFLINECKKLGLEVEEVENTEEKTKKEKVQEEKSSDEITKKDIMAQLDALGIEYNPKARKDELYKLMMGE